MILIKSYKWKAFVLKNFLNKKTKHLYQRQRLKRRAWVVVDSERVSVSTLGPQFWIQPYFGFVLSPAIAQPMSHWRSRTHGNVLSAVICSTHRTFHDVDKKNSWPKKKTCQTFQDQKCSNDQTYQTLINWPPPPKKTVTKKKKD